MSKIAVVYWSGTGNTEIMANKVAEGAKAGGAEDGGKTMILEFEDEKGLLDAQTRALMQTCSQAAQRAEGVTLPLSVFIRVTDDDEIRTINREQRGVDRATDVLSFPMNELTPGAFDPDACEWDYETDRAMLGDMVISMERCAEQAETYGHSFAHEVSYLTVHSVLHLLGYDHVDEGEDKRRMRAREKEIMRLLDV